MDTRVNSAQPDVVTVSSAPGPDAPSPPSSTFSEVMAANAGTVVQAAETSMTVLPGSPITALAVRGGVGPVASPGATLPMAPPALPFAPPALPGPPGLGLGAPGGTAAEGPGLASAAVSPAAAIGTALVAGLPGALLGDGGMQASLLQSQQMNLYYLQLQQEVDAQNRSFTTVSNVLKSENDSEKNAIGNMH